MSLDLPPIGAPEDAPVEETLTDEDYSFALFELAPEGQAPPPVR
jgi:hypothetical protein